MSDDIEFEWDEAKRHQNLAKHGIDFLDAIRILVSDPLIRRSLSEGEERFIAIGPNRGIFWAVVYTMRGNTVRIISARRARRNERRD